MFDTSLHTLIYGEIASKTGGFGDQYINSRRRVSAALSAFYKSRSFVLGIALLSLTTLLLAGCGGVVLKGSSQGSGGSGSSGGSGGSGSGGSGSSSGDFAANPATLDFGTVQLGSSGNSKVSLVNSLSQAVVVSQLTMTNTAYSYDAAVKLPLTIPANSTSDLKIKFDPKAEGAVDGQLTIAYDTDNGSGSQPIAVGFAKTSGSRYVTFRGTGKKASSGSSTALNALSCSSSSVTGAGTDDCTVSLTQVAPSSGTVVSISSSSSSVSVPPSVTVPSGNSQVTFTATTFAVSSKKSVTLTANSAGVAKTFAVTLNPTVATMSWSPTSLSFGNVAIGSPVSKTVTLTSSGSSPLTISGASISGTGYSVSGASLPTTLNPGASVSLNVQFNPTAAGSVSGKLTVSSNSSSGSPTTILLSAAGISTSPTLSSLSCASSSMTGSGTNACTATLSGAAPSGGLSVGLSSNNSAVSTPSSAMVPAGATSVGFTTTVSSVTSSQLATLTGNAGGATKVFAIQLNAIKSTLSWSPTSLSFGNVSVGSNATKTVTLTSSGTGPLSVSAVSSTGSGYSVTGAAVPTTLNPGQTLTLNVTFNPSASGTANGQINISSNSSTGSPTAILLNGTGVSNTPTLSALSCSSASITGSGTDACTATLSGAAPSGGLTVSLSSSSSSLAVPATVSVPANATSASFTATASAVTTTQTANITASAGGATKSYAVQLNPSSTPTLSLSSTSLSFGSVTLNSPATQTVTLTSSGSSAVTISAASITGTGFTYSGATFPLTLNPGQTASVNVQFNPTTAGAVNGQLTFNSDSSSGSTSQVSLSGTGASGSGSGGHYYSTTFPLTENPISESGNWLNGKTNGIAWGNVQTTPGMAFGTLVNSMPPYNDSTAVLTGSWGSNQSAQATVHLNNSSDVSSQEEVELRLNTSITANSITGYEFDASVSRFQSYLVIVRWNGPLNSFCYINTGSSCSSAVNVNVAIHDGDVLQATNVNGTLTFYVNGVAKVTAQDTTYTNGSPGIGFWNIGGNSTELSHYGFSSFTATDTVTSGGSGTSAALSAVSCSASSITGAGTDACTVTLSAAAPSGGLTVGLSSNNAALTVPSSVTVPANATSASFTATATSVTTSQTAAVTAAANSVNKTFGVQLNAATALLNINSSTIAFGNVVVNSPATQTLTLTSSGTLPVTVSSAVLVGSGFTISGASLPLTLNAGQSVSLNLQFNPAATGATTGTLTIVSTSLTSPTTIVTLSGTGITAAVQLTWNAPNDVSDPAVGYKIYRATGTSSTYQLLNSSIDTQTTYTDNTVKGATTYQYYVTSVDAAGIESAPSNTTTVLIP